MPNIMKLMKQAATLQQKMQKLQEELGERTVEFSSGGGMVTAVARGDGTIASLRIDPKIVDPADPEMLEDVVLAAVQGALAAAKEMVAAEMGKLTSGLGLPPGMIPGM
ncbi:MAG: YbaB/EbfC family nucleoid-associated protein [Kiritimatiellae bacterium]|nr:YbaB/EbfC family nucleoid-associated protein [Kiritimatiellia bacterium]